jgi:hypothetical protein
MLPATIIKPDYQSWNHNQIINYCWSGNLNDGPDNLGFRTIPTYHYLSHLEEGFITTTKHPLKFKNKFNPAIR